MTYVFKVLKETFQQTPYGPMVFHPDDIIEVEMKMSEYDEYRTAHPELERYFDSPPKISFRGRYGGLSDAQTGGFKDVLAKIGEHHPDSELGNNYSKTKSTKRIKTKEILKKHRNKAIKRAQGR